MMGRKYREQANFFYEFRLDDMIPKGHLLRRINVFVTSVLGDLHEQLGPFYSAIGRPSKCSMQRPHGLERPCGRSRPAPRHLASLVGLEAQLRERYQYSTVARPSSRPFREHVSRKSSLNGNA
jgi:hypothetical protein